MRLALGLGDFQEVGLGQAPRLPQDGAGNRNIVVPGEPADQFPGRVAERRQAMRQFRACFRFDLVNQTIEDVVEQPHMVLVEQARAIEEQCGDAPERLRPSPRRAMLDDVFQFRNKRRSSRHINKPTRTTPK